MRITFPITRTILSIKYVQIAIVIKGSWSLTKSGNSAISPTFSFNIVDLLDVDTSSGQARQITACVVFPYKERYIDTGGVGVDIARFWAYTSPSDTVHVPFNATNGTDRIMLSATIEYSQTFEGTIYYYGLS